MKDKDEFFQILEDINGKDAAEYSRIVGDFDFARYVLKIARIPQEGERQPALFVVRVPQAVADFPPHLCSTPIRRTALEDLLTRKIAAHVDKLARFDEEGLPCQCLSIARPGQTILPRSSLVVSEEFVEARLNVELPVRKGRILAHAAIEIFFNELPAVVNDALIYCNLDEKETESFVNLMEDADQLRRALPTRGLISFIGEGAMPARQHGSDQPDYQQVTSLSLADELRIEMEVTNAGTIRGMGVPTGITVIVGDDQSGRIELMRAMAAGVYNHVPGDGRELVITMPDAVYVCTEPGRSVQRVDISAFIRSGTGDMHKFTTPKAGSAESQAAAAVESLEVGARALLFDESESAPGFLAQDSRLSGLMYDKEPSVIPLASRARQMVDELGISLVVAGSSTVAEFIPVADTVLLVRDHRVSDITKDAKQISIATLPKGGEATEVAALATKARWVIPSSIDPSSGRHDAKIEALAGNTLVFGRSEIDLGGVVQLSDNYQTATIGLILYYGKLRYMDESRPIRELLDLVDRDLSTEGLECLTRDLRGDLARPRRYEIAAALNRLNTLRVSHSAE